MPPQKDSQPKEGGHSCPPFDFPNLVECNEAVSKVKMMTVHCIAGSAKLQLGIIMDNQKDSASTLPDIILPFL